MKKAILFFALTFFSTISYSQLDTKLIASKYKRGIVKIILLDPELEKSKPGSGYLGRGSGFFVTSDGYIFTNRHVVEKCVKGYVDYDYRDSNGQAKPALETYSEELIFRLISDKNFVKAYNTGYTVPVVQVFHGNTEQDYRLYTAEVVSIGMGAYDGALLKIVSDEKGNTGRFNFTPLPIGDSDKVQQGEQLCVFGYPEQVRGSADVMLRDLSTLSTGIMSGFEMVINTDYGFIKTDAEIHPGNSGGPVFNEENKVIGIATAKGVATGIGLVGGINGMFYIAASDANVHQRLTSLGLTIPRRSFSINTVTGKRQVIKSATELNELLGKGGGGSGSTGYSNSSETDYTKSLVFFSNISVSANNNKIPGTSQRSNKFSISKKKGGLIWIYVDNYPIPLNTSQIFVLIDHFKNGKFEKLEDLVFNVASNYDHTYFSYSFYKSGTYRFTIYSKEMKYINSGTLDIAYQ